MKSKPLCGKFLTKISLFLCSKFAIMCPESEEDTDTAGKVDYIHFSLHWK